MQHLNLEFDSGEFQVSFEAFLCNGFIFRIFAFNFWIRAPSTSGARCLVVRVHDDTVFWFLVASYKISAGLL